MPLGQSNLPPCGVPLPILLRHLVCRNNGIALPFATGGSTSAYVELLLEAVAGGDGGGCAAAVVAKGESHFCEEYPFIRLLLETGAAEVKK